MDTDSNGQFVLDVYCIQLDLIEWVASRVMVRNIVC